MRSSLRSLGGVVTGLVAGILVIAVLEALSSKVYPPPVAAKGHSTPGLTVGVVLLAAGIANMLMIPHPAWFWGAAFIVFPVFTYSGTKVGVSHP